MKRFASILALAAAAGVAHADLISEWNFNASNTTPSTGGGVASLIGGTTGTFASGTGSSDLGLPNSAWNTTTYPAQGTGSGTAGVMFMVDTTMFEDITVEFDHRQSNTGSRFLALEYTLDGGSSWTAANVFEATLGGALWHNDRLTDLSAIAGADNNPNFGFRIVSIFAPWLKVVDALKAPVGTTLTVKGWVRTRRDSKADGGLSFVAIHDGTCFDAIQAVCKGSLPNYADQIAKLTTHCAVEVTGVAVQTPKGGIEIQVDPATGGSLTVHGLVDNPDAYPIQPKQHTMEFLREQAHLRVSTNTFGAVARVRHTLSMAIHRFFHERDLLLRPHADHHRLRLRGRWPDVPRQHAGHRQPAAARSVCSLSCILLFAFPLFPFVPPPSAPLPLPIDFSHDFFGKESHLTVSGQLNVETYCCALSRVYTFGPTFRAENSNTSRHLAEFWMIEPEIAFATSRRRRPRRGVHQVPDQSRASPSAPTT
jgi:hypothetical protein